MKVKGTASRCMLVEFVENIYYACEPNNQLNVCTTSVAEGEVAGVKLV